MAEQFPVETNGPANIVTLIESAEWFVKNTGKPFDQEKLFRAIKTEAHHTINYIQALGRGERPFWHTIKENKHHD